MKRSRAASELETGRTVAKVHLKRLKKGEPAFFRWLGAIEVGPGSIEDDIRTARGARAKAARHR